MFFKITVTIIFLLTLGSCSDYRQEIERKEYKTLTTFKVIETPFYGSIKKYELTLPTRYKDGSGHNFYHKTRGKQKNIIYIPYTNSNNKIRDIVIWNGNDNATHDENGRKIPASISATPFVHPNGDGLYIGMVDDYEVVVTDPTTGATYITREITTQVNGIAFEPSREIKVANKSLVTIEATQHPTRLLGASIDKSNKDLSVAYVTGNKIFLADIPIADLENNIKSGSYLELNGKGINQPLEEGGWVNREAGKEYDILTSTHDTSKKFGCMGSSDFKNISIGATEVSVISYDRGYSFLNEEEIVGISFAKYVLYTKTQQGANAVRDKIELEWDDPNITLYLEELKGVRTNRPCVEKIAYNQSSKMIAIATQTNPGYIRVALLDPIKKTRINKYLLSQTRSTGVELVSFFSIADGLPLPKGNVAKNAFSVILRYTNENRLSSYGRKYDSLAYFVLNDGQLIPADDKNNNIKFIFPDLVGGIGPTTAWKIGKYIAIKTKKYLTLIDTTGDIYKGPFAIENSSDLPKITAPMFNFLDGSVGWVDYDEDRITNKIRIFSYRLY